MQTKEVELSSSLRLQMVVLSSKVLLSFVHSFQGWHGFRTGFGDVHLRVRMTQPLVLAFHATRLIASSTFLQSLVLLAVPLCDIVVCHFRNTLNT